MAKDPSRRPADASALVTELRTVAYGAYGPDWYERGRSHLGEAALLLAALWPAGAPPAVQATAIHRISLFRHLAPVKAAVIAGAAVVAAGAGIAVAASLAHGPTPPGHPAAAVQSVSLNPGPTTSPAPSTSKAPATVTTPPTVTTPLTVTPTTSAVGTTSPPPTSTLPVLVTPSCIPTITAVGAFQAGQTQTVAIDGSCFGTGNTSSGADTPYLRISDLTAGWNACWTNDPNTDQVTCDVPSWTDHEIIFGGYTGGYGPSPWVVSSGDIIEVQVWNPQSGKGAATCQVVADSGSATNCSSG